MKKSILILSITITTSFCSAKAQDALAILQNIVTNKANYIGQPFSVLVNHLPIQIKYFAPNMPRHSTFYNEDYTKIAFNFPYNPEHLQVTYPQLRIYWTIPLNRGISNSLFIQTKGVWSPAIATHYGAAIISDIKCITQ